jgi:hypothetical protein
MQRGYKTFLPAGETGARSVVPIRLAQVSARVSLFTGMIALSVQAKARVFYGQLRLPCSSLKKHGTIQRQVLL